MSEIDSTPNRVSEDLVKCLSSIFVRFGAFKDKEKDQLCDPYGICSESKTREVGPYKNLCEVKVSTVELNRTTNAVFLVHRLK